MLSILLLVGLASADPECCDLETPATEESAKPKEYKSTHALGFAAGSTYGVGLSYSRDWGENGIQVTALPVWGDENGLIAGGVNYKRNFHENGKVGLYGSLGLAGMIAKSSNTQCQWVEDTENQLGGQDECETTIEYAQNVAFGPGVGMQFLFWENMLFRVELPLAIRLGTDGFGITPIPNVALMYRWDAKINL